MCSDDQTFLLSQESKSALSMLLETKHRICIEVKFVRDKQGLIFLYALRNRLSVWKLWSVGADFVMRSS